MVYVYTSRPQGARSRGSSAAGRDKTATVNATLQITSVEQLSRVLAKLEGVRDVFSVHRDGR